MSYTGNNMDTGFREEFAFQGQCLLDNPYASILCIRLDMRDPVKRIDIKLYFLSLLILIFIRYLISCILSTFSMTWLDLFNRLGGKRSCLISGWCWFESGVGMHVCLHDIIVKHSLRTNFTSLIGSMSISDISISVGWWLLNNRHQFVIRRKCLICLFRN